MPMRVTPGSGGQARDPGGLGGATQGRGGGSHRRRWGRDPAPGSASSPIVNSPLVPAGGLARQRRERWSSRGARPPAVTVG